jgi:hypothetical protein
MKQNEERTLATEICKQQMKEIVDYKRLEKIFGQWTPVKAHNASYGPHICLVSRR